MVYAAIAIVVGVMILNFLSAMKLRAYVANMPSHLPETNKPSVPISVILPCKGDDGRLFENLETLLNQDYPAAEFVLVTALAEDPAQSVFKKIISAHPTIRIRTVVAGISPYGSEKCNNLLKAIAASDLASQIFVFLDSDGKSSPDLIRKLVVGLETSNAAAVTGYRWYQPRWNSGPEVVRSVWNAANFSFLTDPHISFVWGGGMALRRKTFEDIGIADIWEKSISDDIALSSRIRELRLSTCFLPNCIVVSSEKDSWRSLFLWTRRQTWTMRNYQKSFFWITSFVSVCGNFLSVGLLLLGLKNGSPGICGLGILIELLWIVHIWLYIKLMIDPIKKILQASGHGGLELREGIFILLAPLASFVHACGSLTCLFSNRLRWAGVTYEVKGAIAKRLTT